MRADGQVHVREVRTLWGWKLVVDDVLVTDWFCEIPQRLWVPAQEGRLTPAKWSDCRNFFVVTQDLPSRGASCLETTGQNLTAYP